MIGSAESGSTVSIYTTSDCSGTPVAAGTAATLASPGISVTVADDTTTSFRATATDSAGNTSVCSSPIAFTEDSIAPAPPKITATSPGSPGNNSHPTIRGSGAQTGSSVTIYADATCTGTRLGSGPASAFDGTSGISVAVPANRVSELYATATDAADNVSDCSGAYQYVEDSSPPNTAITAGPAGLTPHRISTFDFSSTEARSRFQCSVDGAAFAICGSPTAAFTTPSLRDGTHNFRVRSIDQAGNVDPTPALRTFTVDATPPNTTITAGPTASSTNRTPTFKFKSSEPGSTFLCSLDGARFKPCTSPKKLATLAFGKHAFSVKAIDRAGNADGSPSIRRFKIVH